MSTAEWTGRARGRHRPGGVRRMVGGAFGLVLVLGVLTLAPGVAQAAGTSVNVVTVQVGDYQDIIAPSASHPTTLCAADLTECGQVDFPGQFTDAATGNYPGSTIGNTPSCQAQYGPTCDATPSLGDWFYDVEPTDDAGLVTGDTITLNAPVGTTFPTNPADYLLVPLCTTAEDDQSSLPSNDNIYSNAFDGANSYDGDFVCSDSLTNGTLTVGQGPQSFSTTGSSVTLGMPFNVSFLDDNGYFGSGNSFGVFITGVTNPSANSYPAQDFGVTTSEQPTFPGFPLNNAGVTFTNGSVAFSSLTASPTTLAVSTTSPTYLTATVVDDWGNPVPNEDVFVQPEPGSSAGLAPGFTPPSSTQSDGTALFEYVDTKAQSVTFEVLDFSTSTVLPPTQVVTWVAGVPTQGMVTVVPSTVAADGVTTALVTAYLADQYGNPDTSVPVTLLPESHTDAAANTGVFNNGIVVAGNTSCLGSGPQVPGESCTAATPQEVAINGSPVFTGVVTFTVADPTAEDVAFGLDDLSLVAGAELTNAPFAFSVDFAPQPPAAAQSAILPATQTVVTGSTLGGTITVTLRDAKKNPVPGLTVGLEPQGPSSSIVLPAEIPNATSGCQGAQAPPGTTDCNGRVAFSVKDTVVQSGSYVASYTGSTDGQSVSGTIGPAVIDFVAGPGDAARSTVVASPTSALANGTAASTVTVTLKDANGDAASGRNVTLSQPAGNQSVITPTQIPDSASGCATQSPAGTSDCSGQVAFTVTDTTPESVTYTATDTTDSPPGGVVITQTATVGFTTTPTLATSTIGAAPPSVPADGSTPSLVTVTLKDASDDPIAGKALCLDQSTGAVTSTGSCAPGTSTVTPVAISGSGCGSTAPAGTTNCNGQAEFDVISDVGGTVTYGFTDVTDYPNGPPIGPTTPVTFTPLPTEAGMSTVTASPTLRLAGASGAAGTSTVTVTLVSGGGVPIAGHDVSLVASSATSTVTPVAGTTTDGSGQVTFEVTDSAPEVVTYTATDTTAGPNVTVVQTATVTFDPDEASVSTIAGAPTAVANGGSSPAGIDDVTVTLDPGVPLVGHQVALLEPGGGHETITAVAIPVAESRCATVTPAGTTDCNGQARFAVTDGSVESVTVGAIDNTSTTTLAATTGIDFLAPAPVVTSVTPDSGPIGGGTGVAIDGVGLTAPGPATTIDFGSVPATDVSCTATQCTAVAPAASGPGQVQVTVTTSGGPSTAASSGAATYTYVPATPTVTGVSPAQGPTSGGTTVTVDGTNFGTTATTTVSFGTATVPVLSVTGSGTQLTAIDPSDLPGTVDVTVTVDGQTSAPNPPADHFTYVAASTPTVTSLSPSVGPITGGTAVTISGANLGSATGVNFGAVAAASVTVNADGTVTAVSPRAGAAGAVDVTVTTPTGTTARGAPDQFTYQVDAGTDNSYWLVASDGGIFAFGQAGFYGSMGDVPLNKPIVGMTPATDGRGYWLVASDGGIFSFGDASFYGSTGGMALNKPIVGMATTPDGKGYWLVASDGGIFAYGDASFYGSTGSLHLNAPIVGMASTPDGRGYWLVAADGGIFTYGDATFAGSAGALHLNKPIVGMAPTSDGHGYWLVASDGGIFTYGDAPYYGSAGNIDLNKPIVGMAPSPDGKGYWLDATDGGIFSYGDAGFSGSMGGTPLNQPMDGMAAL